MFRGRICFGLWLPEGESRTHGYESALGNLGLSPSDTKAPPNSNVQNTLVSYAQNGMENEGQKALESEVQKALERAF